MFSERPTKGINSSKLVGFIFRFNEYALWDRHTNGDSCCNLVGCLNIYGEDNNKKDLLNLCLLQV